MIEELIKSTGCSEAEIIGRNRKVNLSIIRQLCWKSLREYNGWTYARIGMSFDRSHATVLLGIEHVNRLLDANDEFACETWEKMKRNIN